MNNREKILDRVKKLLALATSDNEHEAASAASAASELLQKYNLCIEDVSEITAKDTTVIEEIVAEGNRMISWVYQLFRYVVQSMECRTLIHSGKLKKLVIVGTESNVKVAKLTLEYLFTVVENLARRNASGQGKAYANSYKLGVVEGIGYKLRLRASAAKEAATGVATAVGTALVLRQSTAVADHMARYTGTYKVAPSSITCHDAFGRGMVDGKDVGLDRQLSGNKSLVFGRK